MNITVHDIADYLHGKLLVFQQPYHKDVYPITRPMALDTATRGAITFCRADLPNAQERVQNSKSEVIIVPVGAGWTININGKWLLEVKDPYACFIDVCNHFFHPSILHEVHETAVIGVDVTLGKNISIGANAVIMHAVIGDNVTIHAGAVIGSDGFGFAHDNRTEDGALIRFPHYGNVIIEDDVEIGANAVIGRGTLGSTIIRKGVKIDNLVHVAHNADIGEHTALVAHSMIAGSVTIGAGSWIAPHVAIRDRQTIGRNVLAGLGAVIVTDVEDGQTVIGLPAKAKKKGWEYYNNPNYPGVRSLGLSSRTQNALLRAKLDIPDLISIFHKGTGQLGLLLGIRSFGIGMLEETKNVLIEKGYLEADHD